MVYAIFTANITNPDSLARYREHAAAALTKHGGKVEQASTSAEALDGSPTLPQMVATLSFPDAEAARAWINDPDLAEVHDLRRNAGQTEILLLT